METRKENKDIGIRCLPSNKIILSYFAPQGREITIKTLELVRKVGEVLSSTSHTSQQKTVVKSNFVDIVIYKNTPDELRGKNISEEGANIVMPDSKEIFPNTNGSVTLQVNHTRYHFITLLFKGW